MTSLVASPSHSSPPLLFVIFWNAFTAVHAFFMLAGAWHSWWVLALIPFYAIFFGVGFWMAYSWWRLRGMARQFGRGTIQDLPTVMPGKLLQLQVGFDRVWRRDAALTASMRWVELDSDGDVTGTPDEHPVAGSSNPGATGTVWQGSIVVPAPPTSTRRQRLELQFRPASGKSVPGWSFTLPVQQAPAVPMTREQAQQLGRVVWWIMIVLGVAGGGMLLSALTSSPLSFFRVLFSGGFLLGAYFLNGLHSFLATHGTGSNAGIAAGQKLEGLGQQPFVRNTVGLAKLLGPLLMLAFFLDAFLPDDWGALLEHAASVLSGVSR